MNSEFIMTHVRKHGLKFREQRFQKKNNATMKRNTPNQMLCVTEDLRLV